jgi:hypothetical protein
VGAAQDGRIGMTSDAAAQGVDVLVDDHLELFGRSAQFDQAGETRAGLGEDRQVLAALVDLDLIDPADRGRRGRERARAR